MHPFQEPPKASKYLEKTFDIRGSTLGVVNIGFSVLVKFPIVMLSDRVQTK